jgi:hypothetical protein
MFVVAAVALTGVELVHARAGQFAAQQRPEVAVVGSELRRSPDRWRELDRCRVDHRSWRLARSPSW